MNDRNRETEDALEWLYLGGITALQKNEAVWPIFLLPLLINDGIGRVSLGMREKGGVTGQGVKMEETDNSYCYYVMCQDNL